MKPQPFQINVPQTVLDDLQERLARVRWPDEISGAAWDYGTNLEYLKELTDYWRDDYDWRAQEADLNRFEHYKADIDGFGLHFIHERGTGPNPRPLLLLHGWPDSFYRMVKIIPMLTDPARYGGDPADSFAVIVPSLPGFGFSDRPSERGEDVSRTAERLSRLMTELGYERYAIHGGDGGSPLAQYLAFTQPEAVTGIHLTDIGWHTSMTLDRSTLSEVEEQYLAELDRQGMSESGYVMIQGSKPPTLAYGLNDSPVGLAGWIVEKFRAWSDCGGDVEQSYTKDELLTNIMIYWVTQTINSSIRSYYEGMHSSAMYAIQRVEVPVGMALFPKDNPPPRELAERSLNVQRWTEMPSGGHFAALEEPELLVQDLRAFFRQLG